MSSRHTAWVAAVLFLAVCDPLRAQSTGNAPPTEPPAKVARAVAADPDTAPVPESGAGDPLAPAEVDKPAPVAPGAPAPTEAAGTPPADADPVVILVRERLASQPPARILGAKDDIAGAKAFYAERTQPVWTSKDGLSPRARLAMDEISRADDWGLKASAFELPILPEGPPSTEALAEVEAKLSLAVLRYARHARGGRVEPSSVSRKFDQKPEIFEPRSVMQGIATADAADAYLRGLHPRHAQFEKLRQALLAARNAATADAGDANARDAKPKPAVSAQQIVVNMERWRWMPAELGSFYVWDSIPEQMTHVFDGGKVVLSEKIVVGKLSSPTPIFSADMKYVIFHPSWGVPPGMKQHELAPQLRNTGGGWFSSKPLASSVLKAHGLRVTRGGVPVDPDAIDWTQASITNFEFEQAPGPTNVLGRVKFRFPNKHDVYMHDTPERHLFGGSVRAFSHGCMRVQNPMHLAEVLLAHDKGWSVDEVKQYERRGGEIALATPIPVHVTYFTVTVDDDGKVAAKPDLYGLDSRTATAIEGRDVHISSARPDSAATASPDRKRDRTAAQKPRSKKERRKVAEEPKPFNPFGQLFGNF